MLSEVSSGAKKEVEDQETKNILFCHKLLRTIDCLKPSANSTLNKINVSKK